MLLEPTTNNPKQLDMFKDSPRLIETPKRLTIGAHKLPKPQHPKRTGKYMHYSRYSKSEQKRIVEYFLVNQDNGVKVVELAKYYFISLPTFYNWLKDWRDGRYIEDSIYNTTIAFRRSR